MPSVMSLAQPFSSIHVPAFPTFARSWSVVKHRVGLWSSGACAQVADCAPDGAFGILMYHRLAERVPGLASPTWNVTPQQFRQQLSGLLERGFQAWSLNKLLHFREQGWNIPHRVFAVTFDDAYECVFRQALPVLRELRVPATIFLATAFLDSNEPFPSDDWSGKGHRSVPAEAWRPLRTAQVQALLASGLIELGAHTHTHADFRGKPVALANDLQLNVAALRNTFSVTRLPFAFPYGTKGTGFASPQLVNVVREAGLRSALHTEPELAQLSGDPFDWGRFNVEPEDNAFTLAGKLTGWFSFWKARLAAAAGALPAAHERKNATGERVPGTLAS
jgi:peptidoglycan/xylan/chitin deacetylase (PgdA/CDA1 family)